MIRDTSPARIPTLPKLSCDSYIGTLTANQEGGTCYVQAANGTAVLPGTVSCSLRLMNCTEDTAILSLSAPDAKYLQGEFRPSVPGPNWWIHLSNSEDKRKDHYGWASDSQQEPRSRKPRRVPSPSHTHGQASQSRGSSRSRLCNRSTASSAICRRSARKLRGCSCT